MKITGIVAEYNPLHNGHVYHIEKTREITNCDYIIAVMSGNFVQRGMPAAFDKFKRCQMALKAGADMVIELPVYYASASAEYFSQASVQLLNATGVTDSICFGSESGNIEKLKSAAGFFRNESEEYKNSIKAQLDLGFSYPSARKTAYEKTLNTSAGFLDMPNNILAIEYLKALNKTNSNIIPYTIERIVSGYHSTGLEESIASATAIRKGLSENKTNDLIKNVPDYVYEIILREENRFNPDAMDNFSSIFHYILRTNNHLKHILDIDEDLENRIYKISNDNFLISDILKNLKCKRYTMTRLQRCILHVLLNIEKETFELFNDLGGPQYIRVLGVRKESTAIFRLLKENSSLPIITNIYKDIKNIDETARKQLLKEIETTDLYNLCTIKNKKLSEKNYEYRIPLLTL